MSVTRPEVRSPEPRTAIIEGQKVLVVERRPPIPPTLQLLIDGGRDAAGFPWRPLRVATTAPLRITGARSDCTQQTHRLSRWLEGFHSGRDGVARFLRLEACSDCGAVCVRDRSFDSLDALPQGRGPLKRRDHVMGWYSGSRRNQRTYIGMSTGGAR